MPEKFKLAICQMMVTQDKNENIKKALSMISTAAENKSDMILLPEMFSCPYDNSRFEAFSEDPDSSLLLDEISRISKKYNIYTVAGTIPEKSDGKIYNTSFIFGKNGELMGKYSKTHLFEIDIPGGITFKESDALAAGRCITVVETDLCRIGIAICYDVRFPELFRIMALQDVKLIVVPASFNMVTGPVHWELLMRARAVDNQVYIAAASTARSTELNYISYANSMVADPWGNVISKACVNEEIIYADIDLSTVDRVRNELPLLKNRRTDIYDLHIK